MKIKLPEGATKKAARKGRGTSSGLGKTAGRGTKGQKARTSTRPGFEGGQMPLYRRIARRGFSNVAFRNKKPAAFVTLADLSRSFSAGSHVDEEALKTAGLVKKETKFVKILANGDITVRLTIDGVRTSKGAKAKLLAAKCNFVELGEEDKNENTHA